MYRSLLLALTASLVACNDSSIPSCANSGQSGPEGVCANDPSRVDDVTLFQKKIMVDAGPDAGPEEKKPPVEALEMKSEIKNDMAVVTAPTPEAWILNGFKHFPYPGTVANKGMDSWDTGDTMLVAGMFLVLIIFDVISPLADYSLMSHVASLGFMLLASAVFCVFVWRQRGEYDGIAWATGYALEWALSMDNLFVFHLVFKAFSVPNDQAMKALRIGIYGAVIFRVIFIAFLSKLLSLSYAVDVILGCVLIMSGFAALSDDDEEDVEDMSTVKFCKWLFGDRLLNNYSKDGSMFTTGKDGRLQMTVLFLVVCVISIIDVVFAVDSVGSKTGQIKNLYINLTSSLMGMFSLRSLFFIIRDMAEYFDYVKYGICSILVFVGIDMITSKWYPVSLPWMCAIICVLFLTSVVASILKIVIYGKDEDDSDKEEDKEETKDLNEGNVPS